MENFKHIPIMLQECLEGLNIKENGIYMDGTTGGAGHSKEIANRLTGGRLISLDQDPDAIKVATERLAGLPATVYQSNFRYTKDVLEDLNIQGLDGVLLDLGVSSHQLDKKERGFSYNGDAPLDMRMSQSGVTAEDLVNTLSREELSRIFKEYGEEQYAWYIAGKIVTAREKSPIKTTLELVDIINSAMPPAVRRKSKNPARKTFQALRIAVNGELDALSQGLDDIFEKLNSGGRFCIITFHSLEDRLVKQRFKLWCTKCTCPTEQLICTCEGAKALAITRKPLIANNQEQEDNRRSRSAKLRIIEKI